MEFRVRVGEWWVRGQESGVRSWSLELQLESGKLNGRVEHVERVEMFMLASRPHSSIIYSGSSIEGSDTFGHVCRQLSFTLQSGRFASG